MERDTKFKDKSHDIEVTLTLSLYDWVIGFAHHITERIIWVKFNENRSKGLGDVEWKQNGG